MGAPALPAVSALRFVVRGAVQGTGFRPYVFRLAGSLGLGGSIRNTPSGVLIHVEGEPSALAEFARRLPDEAPPAALLRAVESAPDDVLGQAAFTIGVSETGGELSVAVLPDLATCPDCVRELFDPTDRRHGYVFLNCTACGPRLSIIEGLPYDRPRTAMKAFALCPECRREYDAPADRRFHAQPVACPVCGPHVWLEHRAGEALQRSADDGAAIQEARALLTSGYIVAVKGLGGFHLACDATSSVAVSELRRRKLRVDKPFALMMLDMTIVEQHCFLRDAERELLESPARPIALLRRRPGSPIAPEIAPGQDWVGVMLPYTPLHYLLFANSMEPGRSLLPPLVMTSGNLSEEPIATDNAEARQRLASLADAFLMHDRDIYIRCDDSVARVVNAESPQSEFSAGIYPLRRSRGYSPFPVKLPWQVAPLLAAGAELKNTFCITNRNYAFLSHHIGDMENYETLQSYERGIEHFERLFRVRPEAVAYDLHPNYLASRYAVQRAQREGLEAIGIQHHHAHIAACMAEHGFDGSHPVIGVAFDGTGYGDDGAIWGGEFLVADYVSYQRRLHLEYFPLPGGDTAIRHPARIALALLWSLGIDWEPRLASFANFTDEERATLRTQLQRGLNAPRTSSVGRLFDAAAALAAVRQRVNYEAQAAIEFEALADGSLDEAYPFEISAQTVHVDSAIRALLTDALSRTSPGSKS